MTRDDIVESVVQPGELSSAVCEDDFDTEEACPIVPVKDAQEAVFSLTRLSDQQEGADFDFIVQLDHYVKVSAAHQLTKFCGCSFYMKVNTTNLNQSMLFIDDTLIAGAGQGLFLRPDQQGIFTQKTL